MKKKAAKKWKKKDAKKWKKKHWKVATRAPNERKRVLTAKKHRSLAILSFYTLGDHATTSKTFIPSSRGNEITCKRGLFSTTIRRVIPLLSGLLSTTTSTNRHAPKYQENFVVPPVPPENLVTTLKSKATSHLPLQWFVAARWILRNWHSTKFAV